MKCLQLLLLFKPLDFMDMVPILVDNHWIQIDELLLDLEVNRVPNYRRKRVVPGLSNACEGHSVSDGNAKTDAKNDLRYEEGVLIVDTHDNGNEEERQ
jgi:hypothetical protein